MEVKAAWNRGAWKRGENKMGNLLAPPSTEKGEEPDLEEPQFRAGGQAKKKEQQRNYLLATKNGTIYHTLEACPCLKRLSEVFPYHLRGEETTSGGQRLNSRARSKG